MRTRAWRLTSSSTTQQHVELRADQLSARDGELHRRPRCQDRQHAGRDADGRAGNSRHFVTVSVTSTVGHTVASLGLETD
jgi:hypothetical protein